MSRPRAFRAWQAHLEKAIGMADAGEVVGHLEDRVTRADLEAFGEQLTDRLSSLWRRDLLLVLTGQFVALAGVLTAIT